MWAACPSLVGVDFCQGHAAGREEASEPSRGVSFLSCASSGLVAALSDSQVLCPPGLVRSTPPGTVFPDPFALWPLEGVFSIRRHRWGWDGLRLGEGTPAPLRFWGPSAAPCGPRRTLTLGPGQTLKKYTKMKAIFFSLIKKNVWKIFSHKNIYMKWIIFK